jgi:hypothetical protein
VPNTLNVIKADLTVESAYVQPEFEMFGDTPALVKRLFVELQGHDPQIQNMQLERGSNNFGELHVNCNLYDSRVGIRVYADKVVLIWINLTNNEIERFGSLFVSALGAVKGHRPAIQFRTHTMNVVLNGHLKGQPVRDYLSTFVRNVPEGLGPRSGNGGVIYFGPADDRILSTFTVDLSATVSDGLFVRQYVVWDGSKVGVAEFPRRATAFLRQAVGAFGLEIPSLMTS